MVDVRPAMSQQALADELARVGVVNSPRLFSLYLTLVGTGVELVPGQHLLNDALSPRSLAQRLGRVASRDRVKVTVPEGYTALQIAERLESHEVCGSAGFSAATRSASLRRELEIRGPSVEGFLFPATYELSVDSTPEAVIRVMVRTFRRRLQRLEERHPGALARLRKDRGWGEHEIVTLASIVEREAAKSEERPTIASVYLNRLDDPEFRPPGMLQADPTAAYGCLVLARTPASCAGFAGRVTPAMLRDASNPYNTYKHPGLPPGPIANPGAGSLEAVLAPAKTDFLFFVASGNGRHTFSRTLDEHNRAVHGSQRLTRRLRSRARKHKTLA